MSYLTIINFNNPDEFVYSKPKIEVTTSAVLKQNGGLYWTDDPLIFPINKIRADSITMFFQAGIIPPLTEIRYLMVVNDIYQWYNVATMEWEESDGTVSKSNTFAELQANISSLDLGESSYVTVGAILRSTDGTATPQLFYVGIGTGFTPDDNTLPASCLITGYIMDSNSRVVEGADIRIYPERSDVLSARNYLISDRQIRTRSNAQGYFSMTVLPSSKYDTRVRYWIEIEKPGTQLYYRKRVIVPQAASAQFRSLEEA